jgi:signal transduction histidine kinase
VQDSGPGIPEDIAHEVFKPFFTTRTEGTGLGLAISKDIIEKHNGKIWFESNNMNGTVFYISLPVKRKTSSV